MPRAGYSGSGGSSQPSLWGSGSGPDSPPTRPRDYEPVDVAVQDEAQSSEPAGRVRSGQFGMTPTSVPGGVPGRFGADMTGPAIDPDALGKPRPPGVILAPGVISFDPTSPAGALKSIQRGKQESDELLDGLNKLLFGKGTIIGDTPVLGDVIQGAATVVGGGADLVVGAAERLPSISGGAEQQRQEAAFKAAPDSDAKREVERLIAEDAGRAAHLRYEFLKAQTQSQQWVDPKLAPELEWGSGTLADDVTELLEVMGLAVRPIERLTAGAGKATGLNRLQEIEAIVNGGAYTGALGTGFAAGAPGASEVELHAYTKWKDGTWTQDQALDFLSAAGAGFHHDPIVNTLAEVALDPTVFGSVGASSLNRLGVAGQKLAASPAARLGADAASYNVLGKVARTDPVNRLVRAWGADVYTPLGASSAGRAAKVARTIIDPLHAIGGNRVTGKAVVDVMSEMGPRVMDQAHGILAANEVMADLQRISPDLLDMHIQDKATYSMNHTRKLVVDRHIANTLVQKLGDMLDGLTPGAFVDDLMKKVPREYVDVLRERMAGVRQMLWDEPGIANLGQRMAALYGGGFNSAAQWADLLRGKSTDYLSILHASTFGRMTTRLTEAVTESANLLGAEAAKAMKLDRMMVLNRDTLTDLGAQGILARWKALEEAGDVKGALAYFRQLQNQYPSLRYVSLDSANVERSLDKFAQRLRANLDDGVLPHQLTDAEIKGLPQPLADLDGVTHDVFTLAIRPEDDLLMGLADDGDGLYIQSFEPWVDHVAVSSTPYRGSIATRFNVAGMPIVGEPVGRVLDLAEAASRTLRARVSSRTITNAAHTRWNVAGQQKLGLTGAEADNIFTAMVDRAGLNETTVRGLSESSMWEVARPLLPERVAQKGVTSRDIMVHMIEAWEGDLRFVGLTQKFTGRAKTLWAQQLGNNYPGQISENLYPAIKFRLNPLFQMQERIEPWVLNAQRGANPALGTIFSDSDRIAAEFERRLATTSPNRAANFDMVELSAQGLIGKSISDMAAKFKPPSRWAQMRDVKGAKRINAARTFAHDMGTQMRTIWDTNEPGTWDRMVAHESEMAGRLITDDEFAMRYLVRQSQAGEVTVNSVVGPGSTYADWRNSIDVAHWSVPSTLGELRPLDIDFMAQSMAWSRKDGTVITTAQELRAALADKTGPGANITDELIADGLSEIGAHPDYIRRTVNALNFSWDGFWRTARSTYDLDPSQVKRLQSMMRKAARLRNMTPVDYVSQLWSPYFTGGEGAAVEALSSSVSLLKFPKEGASVEDLVTQLADIFHTHLDPSMQETLLTAFSKDLIGTGGQIEAAQAAGAVEDLAGLNKVAEGLNAGRRARSGAGVWDDATSRTFANRMLDYIQGRPPTEAYDTIVDAAQGVDEVRVAAAGYMKSLDLPVPEVRRYFPVDPDFGRRTAAAYDALPEVQYTSSGRVTQAKIDAPKRKLKRTPEGVDATTVRAYQAFVDETLGQYAAIKRAGVRFEPVEVDPYPNSAAMVADVRDNKRLKVYVGNSSHPLMTDEQNAVFRGVHDYFAHAAEGFQFGARGELNAAVKHAQMYSPEARRAMLTETHGQNSVVNFSEARAFPDPVVESPATVANEAAPAATPVPEPVVRGTPNADAFRAAHSTAVDLVNKRPNGAMGEKALDRLRAVDEDARVDLGAAESALDDYRSITRSDYSGDPEGYVDARQEAWEAFQEALDDVLEDEVGLEALDEIEETLVLDSSGPLGDDIEDVRPGQAPTGARIRGLTGTPNELEVVQFGGATEVIAYGPDGQAIGYVSHTTPTNLSREATLAVYVDPAFRRQGVATRLYDKLDEIGVDISRETGKTVTAEGRAFTQNRAARQAAASQADRRSIAEVNREKPGTIYATQKAGILPQDILDEFGRRFVGSGKGLESNPDVIRATQYFAKWSKGALADGLLGGDRQYQDLLSRVTGIPTDAAAPYNVTQQLLTSQVGDAIHRASEDAFRLQYFARNRTMFERSLNHPFFGIYPASYMFGKILPEVARFVATEPFGIRTGTGLYATAALRKSMATQMEYDPEFEGKLDELGHSSAMWLMGYMIPTIPWDVGAAAPSWVRNLAEQALANQRRRDRGEEPKPIDLEQSLRKIADYVSPFRPIQQVSGPLDEINAFISGAPSKEEVQAEKDAKKARAEEATRQRRALREDYGVTKPDIESIASEAAEVTREVLEAIF